MKAIFFICVAASNMLTTSANEFLKQPTNQLTEHVSEEDIRVSLLEEVESSIGAGSASKRLSQMEVQLRPIVAALPKNQYGNMGHSAVRYALHRLFVLRHGWVIKGLKSNDGLSNSSSPSGVLTDQVPAYIEALFEQRLAGKGFGLHEVAVLAATIEHLIHDEAVSKLGSTFNLYSLPVTSALSETEVAQVLDTYMMTFILGEHIENMTLNLANTLTTQMPEVFLAWKDTQKFVNKIRANLSQTEGVGTDFASVARVAEEVGEHFGSFQDFECQDLKKKLVDMEFRGTGRVKLSDFYKPAALDGAWTFQESVGYLRSLGLLDESDADHPSVMIANYVTSEANCIASSGFYSVCCKNECEGLLGHLEDHLGAHEAEPNKIAALVASLPSSTITTPNVSAALLQRLDEIAEGHGGKIPLHGRLFAQWMHHVYPRECPYPHMSGVADSKGAKQFMDEGSDPTATEEEMMQYVTLSTATAKRDTYDLTVEDVSPWTSEEELFVSRSAPSSPTAWEHTSSIPAAFRSAALLAASGSLAFGLIQTIRAPIGEALPTKYVV